MKLPSSLPARPEIIRGQHCSCWSATGRPASRSNAWLKIRGLSATHPTTGRGINDIDLTLERGSFTVISGPVGAGTTTLVRALLGLMPAEGGTVTWNGRPVTDLAAFMVPAAHRLPAPGAPAVQRVVGRQRAARQRP